MQLGIHQCLPRWAPDCSHQVPGESSGRGLTQVQTEPTSLFQTPCPTQKERGEEGSRAGGELSCWR